MRVPVVVALLTSLPTIVSAEIGNYQSYVSGLPGDLLWVINTQSGQVRACDSLGLDCVTGPESTVSLDVGSFELLGSGKPGTVWVVNTKSGDISACSFTGPISCFQTKSR